MTSKTIIRLALLAFIVVSIAALAVKHFMPAPGESILDKNKMSACAGAACVKAAVPPAVTQDRKVIAYYFHGSARCRTCRTIEAYTREAVADRFGEELKQGRLELRTVNIDEPSNEHFVQDFQLSTRSVVLSAETAGKPGRWKNLDKVWELVRDQPSFKSYIQNEVGLFLE